MPTHEPPTQPAEPGVPQYEIRVEGHLGSRWAAWFDGLEVATADDGTTVLRGAVADQSGLHGLLQKLRDLGIPLLALVQLPVGDPADGRDVHTQPSHNPSGATS